MMTIDWVLALVAKTLTADTVICETCHVFVAHANSTFALFVVWVSIERYRKACECRMCNQIGMRYMVGAADYISQWMMWSIAPTNTYTVSLPIIWHYSICCDHPLPSLSLSSSHEHTILSGFLAVKLTTQEFDRSCHKNISELISYTKVGPKGECLERSSWRCWSFSGWGSIRLMP